MQSVMLLLCCCGVQGVWKLRKFWGFQEGLGQLEEEKKRRMGRGGEESGSPWCGMTLGESRRSPPPKQAKKQPSVRRREEG